MIKVILEFGSTGPAYVFKKVAITTTCLLDKNICLVTKGGCGGWGGGGGGVILPHSIFVPHFIVSIETVSNCIQNETVNFVTSFRLDKSNARGFIYYPVRLHCVSFIVHSTPMTIDKDNVNEDNNSDCKN